MDRYFRALIIICLLAISAPAQAAIKYKGSADFVAVNAVQYKAESAFYAVMPKAWSGSVWYSLILEYLYFVMFGQSNVAYVGDAGPGSTLIALKSIELFNDNTVDNDGLTGISGNTNDRWCRGRGPWIGFAHRMEDAYNQKVIIHVLGVGGSGLWVESGSLKIFDYAGWGYWLDDLWPVAKTEINDGMTYLTTQGYNYTFAGFIMFMGVNDSLAISNGYQTKATYKEKLHTLIDDAVTVYPNTHFWIIEQAPQGGAYNTVADAQTEVCADREDATICYFNSYTDEWIYSWHYLQSRYDEIGQKSADNIWGYLQ